MVALKLVRPDVTMSEAGAARLIREARAMARLSHANVLTVHEVGTIAATDDDAAATVFIAMELVDGGSLGEWLRDGRIRSRETVVAGLDAMPDAFTGLYRGENTGKTVVRLDG